METSAVASAVEAAAIPATVIAAAEGTATTVETSTATAVTSTTTVTSAAMLGESGGGRADQGKGSDTGEKSRQPGGFTHFDPSSEKGGGLPGRANRLQLFYSS